jgi:aspartate racemase
MHIGIIGGIGPAVTFFYYQRLFELARANMVALELTVVHCDMPQFLKNFANDEKEKQALIYVELSTRLKKAGADFVVLPSIGGSFCLKEFLPRSSLPVLDVMTPLRSHLSKFKGKTLGLIGTNRAMDTKIYNVTSEVDWLIPLGDEFEQVHKSYVELATDGKTNRKIFKRLILASENLIDRGAEAVVLGGTDMFLAFGQQKLNFKVIDCAEIHIDHISRLAIEECIKT